MSPKLRWKDDLLPKVNIVLDLPVPICKANNENDEGLFSISIGREMSKLVPVYLRIYVSLNVCTNASDLNFLNKKFKSQLNKQLIN